MATTHHQQRNGSPPDSLMALLSEAALRLRDDPLAAERCLADAVLLLAPADDLGKPDPFPKGGLAPWQMRKVEAAIEERLADRIVVADLAALTRLSLGHFTRAFRVSFGDCPHAFVMGRRVEAAKRRMLSTDDPLAMIALDCGLSDQAHFSRLFRKLEGEAPAAWRRRNVGGHGLICVERFR